MALQSDRATLAAFVLVSVLAGGNAVGVRLSNRELDPLWGAGLRFVSAALILLLVMVVMKILVLILLTWLGIREVVVLQAWYLRLLLEMQLLLLVKKRVLQRLRCLLSSCL